MAHTSDLQKFAPKLPGMHQQALAHGNWWTRYAMKGCPAGTWDASKGTVGRERLTASLEKKHQDTLTGLPRYLYGLQ